MQVSKRNGVFNGSAPIYAGFFSIHARCKRHYPELNPLRLPLSKICAACGKIEPLDKREISWPSNVALSSYKRSPSGPQKYHAFPLLVALVAFLFTLHPRLSLKDFKQDRRSAAHFPTKVLQSGVRRPNLASNHTPQSLSEKTPASPAMPDSSADTDKDVYWNPSIQGIDVPVPSRHNTVFTDAPKSNAESERAKFSPAGAEAQIARAIAARAISGVDVTIHEHTVRLRGVVKTESQKLMAERAARTVSGVTDVQNLLRVEWRGEND
jgi:hypothetical protein